jgi:hypothetical protein
MGQQHAIKTQAHARKNDKHGVKLSHLSKLGNAFNVILVFTLESF